MRNVHEESPILEELKEAAVELEGILGSTCSFEALNNFATDFLLKVADAQATRQELYKKDQSTFNLVSDSTNPDAPQLLLTGDESAIFALIANYNLLYKKGLTKRVLEDEWSTAVKTPAGIVALRKTNAKSGGAREKFRAAFNVGGEVLTPLPASGFSITVSNPGKLELLALDQKLSSRKIEKVRNSNGIAYSASQVVLKEIMVDFILAHVTKTSIGITDPSELKTLIADTDFDFLVHAMASVIYPDGFPLVRPHLTSVGGCGHVNKYQWNLRRSAITRVSRLTEEQYVQLARQSNVTVEAVKSYQANLRPDVTRIINCGNGFGLRMRIPTLDQYFKYATSWQDKLEYNTRLLASTNSTADQREQFLTKALQVASIDVYGSYIEATVSIDDEGNVIDIDSRVPSGDNTDIETQYKLDSDLDAELAILSSNREVVQKVSLALGDFIQDMTLGIVVIPKTMCQNCKAPITPDDADDSEDAIIINPFHVFFTLLRHKIQETIEQ